MNATNLKRGLATFIALPLMQKRHDEAIASYKQKTTGPNSVPHEEAIRLTLRQATKGLKNSDSKLRAAYEAAGLNADGSPKSSAVAVPATARTAKIKTAATTVSTHVKTGAAKARELGAEVSERNTRRREKRQYNKEHSRTGYAGPAILYGGIAGCVVAVLLWALSTIGVLNFEQSPYTFLAITVCGAIIGIAISVVKTTKQRDKEDCNDPAGIKSRKTRHKVEYDSDTAERLGLEPSDSHRQTQTA